MLLIKALGSRRSGGIESGARHGDSDMVYKPLLLIRGILC